MNSSGMASGMAPVLHLPEVMSDATEQHLARTYHPAQRLSMGHAPANTDQSGAENVQSQPSTSAPSRAQNSIPTSRQDWRMLPSLNVTDETFDDAYVAFIMYCNPTVATETDSSELRKIFRAPPKSDGKVFNTFTLFELIRKLEEKEIKTWAQLAIDLGVEPPALEKGQSAQKVQQYAVRLKRWMHAMHVDAFFEYLLHKPHVYWTQVPNAGDSNADAGRDGVPAEEDLALRALLPETRPKRGRRKAEDREDDIDSAVTPSQRRRIDSPGMSDDFMIGNTPASAHPNFNHNFNDTTTPWSTTEPKAPNSFENFRWNQSDEAQTPMSAYPRSAITPSTRMDMWNDGSRSAITPNKPRIRRKHGPAVSSAWPSNGSSSTGKLRGRPPTNRNTTDGPFSTFPANPASKDVPTINLQDAQSDLTPTVERSNVPHFFPPTMNTPQTSNPLQATQNGRPNRLSLQVPQREGGSVRLATPPPVVLVNGQENTDSQNMINAQNLSLNSQGRHASQPNLPSHLPNNLQSNQTAQQNTLQQNSLPQNSMPQNSIPQSSTPNPLQENRAVQQNPYQDSAINSQSNLQSTSTQQLSQQSTQPMLNNQQIPMHPHQQNALNNQAIPVSQSLQNFTPGMEYFTTPDTFQHFVDITFRQTPSFDRTNVDALESHFISEILAADWVSGSNLPIERCSIDEASKICKQIIKNLQAESSSTEAFLINLSALAGGPLMTKLRMTRNEVQGRTDYECHWRMRFGSIEGDFTIRASLSTADLEAGVTLMGQEMGALGDGEDTWKRRYLDLQQEIRDRDRKVGTLKRSIVDALSSTVNWGPA